MKNLTKLLVVAMVAGLTACASDDEPAGRNYRYVGANQDCGETLVQKAAPVRQAQPTPVPAFRPCNVCQSRAVAQAPAARPCNGCQPTEYTVRTPVKVVYKNTTYRTVYEPRTYETTSFETRPFNRGEACADGNCGAAQPVMAQQPVVTQQPVLQQSAPVVQETVEVYEK